MRPGALSALLEELARAPADESGAAWDRGLHPGAVFGRFELVREVGRGGFGVVYEAKDLSLGRMVAFKAVRAGRDASLREELLLREAEAAARLSHPNIVTLHDVGRSEHGPFLVLELLHGRTLAQRLADGPMPLPEALSVGLQVARGLAHAHEHGVVHRDLSPGNIHLGDDGQVKVLDLGLAHAFGRPRVRAGTSDYMAPEQAADAPQDERADVFALGVVLHRAISGALPFRGNRTPDAVAPALDVPTLPALGALVGRMLERDPLKRPRNGGEVAAALAALRGELERTASAAAASAPSSAFASRRVVALAAALVVIAAALVGWFVRREARVRWALQQVPRIAELVDGGRYADAFALAKDVEVVVPDDPKLLQLWPAMSYRFDVETTPEGAEVELREYAAPDAAWRRLGRTPLREVRLPIGLYQWRISRAGFATVDRVHGLLLPGLGEDRAGLKVALDEVGALPPEMVRVSGGEVQLRMAGMDHAPAVQLADFLVDRTEVTNRRFKRFVDAGGYRDPGYWQEPIEEAGRPLSFTQAMARFHDRTGRPGPATWESGDYPEGQGDLPVTGVSWYEAAAFAAFEHKALPTVYQWSHAAGLSLPFIPSFVVPRSNFEGKGLAPATVPRGMGPFGTYDMAGNAKEWCRNASGDRRYILGGAWDETYYYFTDPDAQPPLARTASHGIRLVRTLGGGDDPAAARPLTRRFRDYAHERPVSAEIARAFARIYAYDRTALEAKVEAVDDAPERWRKEKVSFTAAYGGERITAYLFTPRNVAPPYQTVVFFPGSFAMHLRSSESLDYLWMLAPVIKSGRALLYPIYKSTYERGDGWKTDVPSPTAAYREHVAMWTKDVRRSLDFVETRPDLDATRVALYGLSWGAVLAPLLMSVDERIRVGIAVGGGLFHQASPPEADPFNFAPLVTRPVLVVNGRYDYFFPVETSQVPLFERLGAPGSDKRHVILDTRHLPPNDLLTTEVLDWLDRHLGAVR